MKNILLIFLIISTLSCEEKRKEIKPENSVIREKIIEKKDEVVIKLNDTINSFFTNLFLDEMQEKPDMIYLGQKEHKTSVTIPTQNTIKIIGGDPFASLFYEIQLEKGDSLLINIKKIDLNQSKQIEYPIFELLNSDETWSENNFGYLLYNYNINNKAIVIDEDKFQNNKYDLKKIYTNSIKLLDSLIDNNSISEKFYSTNRINQKLKFATSKIREAKSKNIELDIDNFGIKLNEEELLRNREYVSFLKAMILYNYFKEDKRTKSSILFDFINEKETFLSETTKQVLLDSYLKGIYFTEKLKFDKYLIKFNNVNNNQEFKDKWDSVADKQKANSKKLNTTNRTVGILTNLVNDNELTFEEVLSYHQGKVVLVDFWASWCAPCRKEMPLLRNLKSKFSENELKVIEISIDKDFSSWARASKLEKLSNEKDSYIIANWENSSIYKNYNIKTIPRYLLFGKDGKIIDENAPRPSQLELAELIKANI